jgi:hypothetical protein
MGDGGSISRHLTAFMKALLYMRERERERERVIIKTGDILKRLGILYNIHCKYAH